MNRLVSTQRLAVLLAVFGLLAFMVAGCRPRPEKLLAQANRGNEEARQAGADGDVQKAYRGAEKAQEAADTLKELAESARPERDEARRFLGEAQAAARAARDCAELADERNQCGKRLARLKIKAYRRARDAILSTLLPQVAQAADKAARQGTNTLSVLELTLAEQAWNLSNLLTDRPPLEDGTRDWSGAAADLWSWSTNPPPEFNAFIGLGFHLAGFTDFALAEMESANAAQLTTTNGLLACHGGKALVYVSQGWDHMAAREMESLAALAPATNSPFNGQQIVAVFHGCSAYESLKKRDLVRADAELARAFQAWPDNPVAVFLTGERLAASGEWVKAADSLEAQAAGTDDEEIARLLAQRARDLRDGKGNTKALLVDDGFLLKIAVHSLMRTAKSSAAAEKLEQLVDEAAAFAKGLTEKLLPGGDD